MLFYVGGISDKQESPWRKALEVFDEDLQNWNNLSLFPDDREIPADAVDALQVKPIGLQPPLPPKFWLARQTIGL